MRTQPFPEGYPPIHEPESARAGAVPTSGEYEFPKLSPEQEKLRNFVLNLEEAVQNMGSKMEIDPENDSNPRRPVTLALWYMMKDADYAQRILEEITDGDSEKMSGMRRRRSISDLLQQLEKKERQEVLRQFIQAAENHPAPDLRQVPLYDILNEIDPQPDDERRTKKMPKAPAARPDAKTAIEVKPFHEEWNEETFMRLKPLAEEAVNYLDRDENRAFSWIGEIMEEYAGQLPELADKDKEIAKIGISSIIRTIARSKTHEAKQLIGGFAKQPTTIEVILQGLRDKIQRHEMGQTNTLPGPDTIRGFGLRPTEPNNAATSTEEDDRSTMQDSGLRQKMEELDDPFDHRSDIA